MQSTGTNSSVYLTSDINNYAVDLVISGCSGGGNGAFTAAIGGSSFNIPLKTTQNNVIDVSYMPVARGPRSCTVNVYSTGTTTPTLASFTISGVGVAPVVGASNVAIASPVRYSDLAAIHTANVNLVVSNTGDAGQNLTLLDVGSDNTDWTVTPPGPYPVSIAAGANATFVLTLNPSAAGADNANIIIHSNDPITPTKTVSASGTGGTATITTSDIDFMVVNQATTSTTQNINVTNTAASNKAPMGVTQAMFVNNTAGWFRFNQSGCIGTTSPCVLSYSLTTTTGTVGIQCAPPANASGTQTASVIIASDADNTTDNAAMLSCTAGRADIIVTTTPLAFGNQLVNTTSAVQYVMIQNTGNATLTYSAALAGTDANQFATTGAPCTASCSLTAGASLMYPVYFSPTSSGSKSAVLRVTPTNDPDTIGPIDVSLSGTSIAPVASFNVTSMAFGSVEVGSTATAQTLTVSNTGTADLSISTAYVSLGATSYVVPMGTTGNPLSPAITVAPNASASWTIACKPTAQGSQNGTFHVVTNSSAAGATQDITLTCTGTKGNLTVTASTFDFGQKLEGSMTSQTFTLTNNGNLPVTNVSVTPSGTGTGYSILSPTFPISSIAVGGSVTVTVQFYPLDGSYGGAYGYTFSGVWGASTTMTSATLNLNGDGISTGFDTTPSAPYPLDWGNIRFDTPTIDYLGVINTSGTSYNVLTVTITPDANTASSELVISSCVKGGPSSVTPAVSTTNGCPTAATPYTSPTLNDTMTVKIQCKPNNRVGMLGGTILVHTNLPDVTKQDKTIALKCNSVTGVLSLDPGTVVDFGATDLDKVPVAVTKTVTITNTGAATMNITASGTKAGAQAAAYAVTAMPAAAIAPNATYSFDVTYTPTGERPANQPDVATITLPLAGAIGTPGMVTLSLTGYGADRHLAVAPAPVFPPTFRNPGDAAPVMPVTITNNGDFPLNVSAVMLSDDPIWTIVDPDPVTVPGRGTHDFNVKFSPNAAGKAPTGHFVLMDDDNAKPSVSIDFDGVGLDRNISITPMVIDFGYAPIGGTVRLSDVSPSTPLEVVSMETAASVKIHAIQVDGEGFTVIDETGASPSDLSLDPGTKHDFDILFNPEHDGTFTANATLYLDQDPTAQAIVELRGHAAKVDVHGGGGCSAGGDLGGASLIVIAMFWVARRRRAGSAVVLVVAAVGTVQADNIDSETFQPTPAVGASTFQVEPAGAGKEGEWSANATMMFASNPVAVQATDSGMVVSDERPVARRAGFELGGAYAFLERFEAGVRVPLYMQSGESDSMTTFHIPAAKGASLGDVTLHTRAQLFARSGLLLGAGLHLTLPTSGQNQFVGLDTPSVRVLALAAYTVSNVTFGANAGPIVRKTADYSNDAGIVQISQGSGLAWSIGASFAANARLRLTGEVFGEVNKGGLGGTGYTTPTDALIGLRYGAGAVTVGLAVGRGLSRAFGTPDARGVFVLTFSSTSNKRPAKPEVSPELRDTDNDGIVDALDKCPNEKEDHLGNRTDGCPLIDADHDGIADALDKCPTEAEDKDAYQDDDGCPDLDDDGDTIPDTQDKCPDAAEVINGVDDTDGCPDQAATVVAVGEGKTPQQAAEEAFKQGRQALKDKNYAQACAAFEVSQRLDPQFGTQYNLAGCYIELGKLASGWNLYRELGRTDSNAGRRGASADLAKRIAPRVPKVILKLRNQPPGVSVMMNNIDSTALVGVEVPVDLGSVDIVAGATGYKPWRQTFQIKDEGKTTTIEIDLQPKD